MQDNTTDAFRTGRRLRLTTLQEQQEFMRLARQLIESGVTDAELQRELGYEEEEAYRSAIGNGRVTTERLDKLRQLNQARLPDMIVQKQEETARQSEERMQRLMERFKTGSDTKTPDPAETKPVDETIPPSRRPSRASFDPPPRTRRSKGRKKEFTTPKQHQRLREQIEHLWAVDKRFRNWSLLAKVGGLSSGQAIKRAYEVNSSVQTLQHIETFARLHAGFGSRATNAIKAGIPIDELQDHLMARRGGGADAAETGQAATGQESAPAQVDTRHGRPTLSMDDLPETPPSVDFSNMIELGRAIDVEVKRLWLVAKFFEDVSQSAALPRVVRESARRSREHLIAAVGLFAPEDGG